MPVLRLAMDARCVRLVIDGVARYVLNIVRHLTAREDVTIEIHALTSDEVHPRLASAPGVTCHEVTRAPEFRWNERRLKFEQSVLPRLLRTLNVDLYHATWNYGVPRRCPVPAIVTVHDLMPLTFPEEADPGSRLRRWAWRRSTRIAVKAARRVIAVSHATAADLTRLLRVPPERIRVTHEAPDDVFFEPVTEAAIRGAAETYRLDGPYLLYVGGPGPRKNVGTLLKAAALARERGAPVRLALALKAERVASILEDNGLPAGQEGIVPLGYLPDDDLPPLIAGSRAFVFASRSEGFGLPPLEAMASGTAVLSSNAASLAEVVADGGHLLDPDDVPAWADAMARVWTDDAWRNDLAARGRAHARLFRWSRTADQTLAVYREALGAYPLSPPGRGSG